MDICKRMNILNVMNTFKNGTHIFYKNCRNKKFTLHERFLLKFEVIFFLKYIYFLKYKQKREKRGKEKKWANERKKNEKKIERRRKTEQNDHYWAGPTMEAAWGKLYGLVWFVPWSTRVEHFDAWNVRENFQKIAWLGQYTIDAFGSRPDLESANELLLSWCLAVWVLSNRLIFWAFWLAFQAAAPGKPRRPKWAAWPRLTRCLVLWVRLTTFSSPQKKKKKG